MSKRIVAQVFRVIAVIGTLALYGCTSSPTWTAQHDLGSGVQILTTFPDGLLTLADTEVQVPQTP
jgi:hypothetical protein